MREQVMTFGRFECHWMARGGRPSLVMPTAARKWAIGFALLAAPAFAQSPGRHVPPCIVPVPPNDVPDPALDPARLAAARPVIDALWPLGTYRRIMQGTMSKMMDGMMNQMFAMRRGYRQRRRSLGQGRRGGRRSLARRSGRYQGSVFPRADADHDGRDDH